eukprot:5628597-Pyramimonas_sp.AAC.1
MPNGLGPRDPGYQFLGSCLCLCRVSYAEPQVAKYQGPPSHHASHREFQSYRGGPVSGPGGRSDPDGAPTASC